MWAIFERPSINGVYGLARDAYHEIRESVRALCLEFPGTYWQRLDAKSSYSAGDEVDILYDPRNPSRVTVDSWRSYVSFTILIGGFIVAVLLHRQ